MLLAGTHVLRSLAGGGSAREVSHLVDCLGSLCSCPQCPDDIRKKVEGMCEILTRCPSCTNDDTAECACRSEMRHTAQNVLEELFNDGDIQNFVFNGSDVCKNPVNSI